jgi:hypothetical protein
MAGSRVESGVSLDEAVYVWDDFRRVMPEHGSAG